MGVTRVVDPFTARRQTGCTGYVSGCTARSSGTGFWRCSRRYGAVVPVVGHNRSSRSWGENRGCFGLAPLDYRRLTGSWAVVGRLYRSTGSWAVVGRLYRSTGSWAVHGRLYRCFCTGRLLFFLLFNASLADGVVVHLRSHSSSSMVFRQYRTDS